MRWGDGKGQKEQPAAGNQPGLCVPSQNMPLNICSGSQCHFLQDERLSILQGLLQLGPTFQSHLSAPSPTPPFLQSHRTCPLPLNIPAFAKSVPSTVGALHFLSLQSNFNISAKDQFTPLQSLCFLFLWYMHMALTVSVYLAIMIISVIN